MTSFADIGILGDLIGGEHYPSSDSLEKGGTIQNSVIGAQSSQKGVGKYRMSSTPRVEYRLQTS